MPLLLRIWDARKYLLVLGLMSIAVGMSFSQAMISIGVGIAAGHLVLNGFGGSTEEQPFIRFFFRINLLIWLLVLLSFFWSEDKAHWWSICARKLPLVILPLVFLKSRGLSFSQLKWISWGLIGGLFITDVSTLVNYILHFQEINESILRSKSIPVYFLGIYTSTLHIYLGVLNTLALVAVSWLYRIGTKRWLMLALGAFFVLFIHVLSSRTGILALYGLTGAAVLYQVLARRQYKWGIGVGLALILLPLAAYWTVPSFQNRIKDTWHDLTYKQRGQTNNHMSVSMRFEAWKTSWQVFRRHPVAGVGASDIKPAMEQQYIENQSNLLPENRILPHNQYLEAGATYGVFGLIFVLLSLFSLLSFRELWSSPYHLLLWAAFAFAFFFESLLERELGIVSYTLYPLLAFYWNKAKKP